MDLWWFYDGIRYSVLFTIETYFDKEDSNEENSNDSDEKSSKEEKNIEEAI